MKLPDATVLASETNLPTFQSFEWLISEFEKIFILKIVYVSNHRKLGLGSNIILKLDLKRIAELYFNRPFFSQSYKFML